MGIKRKVLSRFLEYRFNQILLIRAMDVLSEVESTKYFNDNTRNSLEELFVLLLPRSHKNLLRLGDKGDGGYVIGDTLDKSTIVFSIGVGTNTSFDDAISEHVNSVVMLDHTVDFHPIRPNTKFIQKKLVSFIQNPKNEATLKELVNGADPEARLLLKMDIEGAEWEILDNLEEDYLQKFDQLVIEFHGFLSKVKSGEILTMLTVFHKLTKYFDSINTHANNYSDYQIFLNYPIVDVIEVTFIRKELRISDEINKEPKNLNFPNNPNKDEVFLTYPKL